jgi:site-specific recombinase XerD
MRAKITDRFVKESVLKARSLPDQIFPPAMDIEIRDTSLIGFSLIVRKSAVLSFCVRYRNEAGLAKKFTIGKYGAVTTTKAREIAQLRLGEVKSGIDVQALKIRSKIEGAKERSRSLEGFIEEMYQNWITTERKSGEATLARIESNFGEWYGRPIVDINTWLVTNWRTVKIKGGAQRSTINRDVVALKALISKAVEWKIIEHHPLRDLKPLKEDKAGVIRFLTDDEEARLRKALDIRQERQRRQRSTYIEWQSSRNKDELPTLDQITHTDHIKPIVLLDLNTGMRRGEIFNLRLRDIDLHQKLLTVRGGGSKSGQTRIIPLNQEAFQILTAWLAERRDARDDYVFASPVTGRRLTSIKSAWRGLMNLAGIKSFRFHDLRHTFASNLVMKGADLYSVKELLGHANIETTQRYAHLAPEHKSKIVELLSRA